MITRKNIRKRILPLVLAAMVVVSDAGYGGLPIIYAQESQEQTQAGETPEESADTNEATDAAKETAAAEATNAAKETAEAETTEVSETEEYQTGTEQERSTMTENETTEETPADEQPSSDINIEESTDGQEAAEAESIALETEKSSSGELQRAGSGSCGANATYEIVGDTVTISGSGAIRDYDIPSSSGTAIMAPWRQATNVVFAEDSAITHIGNNAFHSCAVSEITLPSTLKSIGVNAFTRCTALKSIEIPESVTQIQAGAFSESGLGAITINSPTEIGSSAFQRCTSLTKAEITYNDNSSIKEGIFLGCTSLKTVKINGKINAIEQGAFNRCKLLTGVEITEGTPDIEGVPTTVTSNQENFGVFSNCESLTSLTVPNGVKSVGSYAFYNCVNLTDITIADGATEIGKEAFRICSQLKKITIPSSITTIGEYAFASSGLEELTFQEHNQQALNIGNGAFNFCRQLKSIIIPEQTTVGEMAFSSAGLTEVEIRDNVTIGKMAFMSCTSLKDIIIGKSVTIGTQVFNGCTASPVAWVHKESPAHDYVKNNTTEIRSYKFIAEQVVFDTGSLEDLEESASREITIQLLPSANESDKNDYPNISTAARTITWEVDDERIATIEGPQTGTNKVTATIKGLSAGTCTITVTCDGVTAQGTLKVLRRVLPVTLNTEAGVIEVGKEIVLSCGTEGAQIYYTTDGSEPTRESEKYEQPIVLEEDAVIKAFAVMEGYSDSEITTVQFIVSKVKDIFFDYSEQEPLEIELNKTVELVLKLNPSDALPRTEVQWESDNPELVAVGDMKQEEGTISAILQAKKAGECTVTAVCDGKEARCKVLVKERVQPVQAVADQEPDVDTGKVLSGTKVTLKSSTPQVKIYYTVNNENELTEDTGILYNQPIVLEEAGRKVIRAIAVKQGWLSSEAVEFTYEVAAKVSGIELNETAISLGREETRELTVSFQPEDAVPQAITWSSSNSDIASVEQSNARAAKVTGKKPGTCVITAACGIYTAKCTVTIADEKRVSKVKAVPNEGEVMQGTEVVLSCDTTDAAIYYTLDGTAPTTDSTPYTKPITLDETVTIKAIAVKEGYTDSEIAEFTFTVKKEVPVTGISLDAAALELGQEETRVLTASLQPEDATTQSITWRSSNSDIASVVMKDETSAKVTAKSAGTCTIMAVCGEYTAQCTVTVTNIKRVSKVSVSPSAGEVKRGTEIILSCDTADAEIYYTLDGTIPSKDSALYTKPITLDEAVTIKAIAVKEGYTDSEIAEFVFTVKDEIAITGITLDPPALVLGQEETRLLTASFEPSNATPQRITWRSSNPEIASVVMNDELSAEVTAKSAGTCTITAVCGDVTAACAVTVIGEKRVSKAYAVPGAGEVKQGTEVVLKCDTEGAEIYYTLDGAIPTKDSTRYTKAIQIDETVTIKAVSVKEGYTDSEIAEFTFTVKKEVPVTGISIDTSSLELGQEETRLLTVSFQPADATPQNITWQSNKPEIAEVVSNDGVSAKVTAKSAGTCTITAACGQYTAQCTVTVADEKRVSKVYAVPGAGEVKQGTEVMLLCDTESAEIYYTLDGTTPTKNSTRYTAAVKINETATIKAVAVREGYTDSEIAEFTFTVKKEVPITGISLDNSSLALGQEETRLLTISFRPADATPQRITWQSSDPDIANVRSADTISAMVTGNKEGKCTVTATCGTFTAACEVTVTAQKRVSQVYSVPSAGSVVVPGTEAALQCMTTGAKIYYTLDGSEPTIRSTPYTKPLILNEDIVIKAIAVKTGYQDSEVAELTFTVNAVLPELPEIDTPQTGIWTTTIADQPYTGSAIKPAVYVYDGNKLLTEKTDYTISYKNNKNLGEGQVNITGKGNYTAKRTVTFQIVERSISDKDMIIEDMAFAYDGKFHKKAPAITYVNKKLKEGKDFEVEYGSGNYIDEGIYEVLITGIGNYTGTATGRITIIGKDKLLSKAKIAKIPAQNYNDGNEITLGESLLSVSLNGTPLKRGIDYTVSYANNVNSGTATVIIKGRGSYAGTKKATFKITRTPVDMAKVTCSNQDSFKTTEFVKGGCMPRPVLTYNGCTLMAGTDYTVSYKNNKKLGSASVVVSGKGNFKGRYTLPFTIVEKDISKVAVRTPNVPYTGKKNKYQSKPVITDTDGTLLKLGTDYTVTYSCEGVPLDKQSNPAEHAEITVNITGKGKYTGSRTDTYKLEGTSFSAAKIKVASKEYTGKAVVLSEEDIQSASIKVSGATSQLTYGVDFEIVSYSKNIKKGTATVVFSGIGKYAGEISVKFKIVNKKISAE